MSKILETLDKLQAKTLAFLLMLSLIVGSAICVSAYFGATWNFNVSATYEERITYIEYLTKELNTTQHWIIQRSIEQILNSSFYPMQKPCSYIINKVGSYYTLQNGTTAKMDMYSTTLAYVIGNATIGMKTLSPYDYGKLVFGSGNFTLLAQNIFDFRCTIEGQGMDNTVINCAQGLDGAFVFRQIVTVRDIRFNILNNVLSSSFDDVALHFDTEDCSKSMLENVFVTRFGIGLKIDYLVGLDIIHCNLFNNYIGLYFNGTDISAASQFINMYGGCIELSRGNPIYVKYGAYVGFYGVYMGNQYYPLWLENFKNFLFDKVSFEPSHANVTCVDMNFTSDCVHWALTFRECAFDLVGVTPSQLYNGDNGIHAYNVTRLIIDRCTIADVWEGKYFLNATSCSIVQVLEPRFYQYLGIAHGEYFIGATYVRCDVSSGNTTISNNEWVSHGLVETPTTITITPRAVTYDSVTFVVGVVARNSTMFQVGAYWTNGTAISNDAIAIDWHAEYKP